MLPLAIFYFCYGLFFLFLFFIFLRIAGWAAQTPQLIRCWMMLGFLRHPNLRYWDCFPQQLIRR